MKKNGPTNCTSQSQKYTWRIRRATKRMPTNKQQNPNSVNPWAARVGSFPGPKEMEFKSDLISACTYAWYASIVSLSKSFSFILKDLS